MTETPQSQLERLLQLDITQQMLPAMGKRPWQALYLSADGPDEHIGIWCALLDDEGAARAIKHDGWDLLIGDGKPGYRQATGIPYRHAHAAVRLLDGRLG